MLELTVFLSGALVMVLEMVGGRVLAPHVGTSAIVWTSLIGVVLACLALGAWAGGRFADKTLSRRGLGQALAGAGLGCALTAFCHTALGAGVTRPWATCIWPPWPPPWAFSPCPPFSSA